MNPEDYARRAIGSVKSILIDDELPFYTAFFTGLFEQAVSDERKRCMLMAQAMAKKKCGCGPAKVICIPHKVAQRIYELEEKEIS